MPMPSIRDRRFWVIAVPVLVLLAVVVGPWLYLNVLRDDAPEQLSFDDVTTTTSDPTDASDPRASDDPSFDGTWTVGAGSQAGYRAKEVLFGQDAEAVGRTEEVSGTLQLTGTTITAVEVTVDMASITSPESRRDGQFRGRIMDVSTYRTSTFKLTEPIELGAVPADGVETTYTATGDLTLRGVTQSLTFDLLAKRAGDTVQVNALIPIDFDDFEIPDASGGPASVGRNGSIELLLVFSR